MLAAFDPLARQAPQEPESQGSGLAAAVQCAGGAGVPGVPWFSLKMQLKVGSQLRRLSQTPPPDCRVFILFCKVNVID